MNWQAYIVDIRIVEEQHVQPVLFGPSQVTFRYRLVDWDTEQPVNETRYDTMAAAEQATRNLLLPYLNHMAAAYAETDVSEKEDRRFLCGS